MSWRARLQEITGLKAIRRAYSLVSGFPVLQNAARRVARAVIPPNTLVWLRISGGLGEGFWVHLDPRFEMIYADGKYETPMQKMLSRYLKPGDVFYDIGAHIGIVSLFGARLVGNAGTVFAFEAEPDNTGRIEEHVARNGLSQIQVISRAVWSSSGPLRFSRASSQSSRNQGAVATGQPAEGENTIELPAVTLDDFVKEHSLPALIKIDVEGGEAEVLRGGESVFMKAKPVVICEVHHAQAALDVKKWLEDRNYAIEWLEDAGSFPCHLVATARI
jgi:FkbM family methyltransferase